MQVFKALVVLFLLILARCASAPKAPPSEAAPPTAEEVFQRVLAPHGEWIVTAPYGRVWVPKAAIVGESFRPYVTAGHWLSTNSGWSFESDWVWGWVPFHYGRWFLDTSYGWVWVPEKTWSPAWVTWRYGGGYVGWTPLAPPGAELQVEAYHPNWCFVEARRFLARDFHQHVVSQENYAAAFRATSSLASQPSSVGPWPAGPDPAQLSHELGQPIPSQQVVLPRPGEMAPHRLHGIAAAKPTPERAPPAPSSAPKQPAAATASSQPPQAALSKEPANSEQAAAPAAESAAKKASHRRSASKVGHPAKHRAKTASSHSRRRRHRG